MNRWTAMLVVTLVLGACRRPKVVDYQTPQAKDIPREVALATLREDLPTLYHVKCTLPKIRYRQRHIKEWQIDADGIRVVPADEDDPVLELAYPSIRETRLYGKRTWFYVRLYTSEQPREDTEHFEFLWQDEERAKRVMELFEALRQKK